MYFNRIPLHLVLVELLAMSSCVPKFGGDEVKAGSRRGSSHFAQVGMNIPDFNQLASKDGKSTVNAIHLSVRPDKSTCDNGTFIDETLAVQINTVINKSIARGCAYDVDVALGKSDFIANKGLSEIYYSAQSPIHLTEEMTQRDRIPLSFTLMLTDAGRRLGLPENVMTPEAVPPVDPTPNPFPTPVPTLNPVPNPIPVPPSNNLTGLPSRLDVALIAASRSVRLSEIFTTPYLVVDFSRPGCGYCVDLANQMNQDRNWQKMMSSGSKCRALTVIPPGQLSDWYDAIGGPNSFSAKEAYEYSGSHDGFARLVNYSVTGTPAVIIIDRSGKVVDDATGTMPSQLNSICGG